MDYLTKRFIIIGKRTNDGNHTHTGEESKDPGHAQQVVVGSSQSGITDGGGNSAGLGVQQPAPFDIAKGIEDNPIQLRNIEFPSRR